MARAWSSRRASRPLPFLRHEGRQQYDLLPPVKSRIVGQAHRIGAAERNREDRNAGPADNDAEPGRREAELRRARLRHFGLAQDAVRPGIAQEPERAVEARLETGGSFPYCRAPTVLGADEMPIATRGGDVDIAGALSSRVSHEIAASTTSELAR